MPVPLPRYLVATGSLGGINLNPLSFPLFRLKHNSVLDNFTKFLNYYYYYYLGLLFFSFF